MPTPKAGYRDAEGNTLPGVTTILKQVDIQFLIGIANKMGLKGRETYGPKGEWERAADIGTCAHARIEAFIKGATLTPAQWCLSWTEVDLSASVVPGDVQKVAAAMDLFSASTPAYESFLKWADGREFKGRTEVGLVHSQGFGGTIDYLPEEEIFDWKTSRQLGASAVAQVCGGYGMLCEENLFVPRLYHVVRFPKEGGEAEQWTIRADSPTATAGRVMFMSLLESYKATAQIEAVNKIRMKKS